MGKFSTHRTVLSKHPPGKLFIHPKIHFFKIIPFFNIYNHIFLKKIEFINKFSEEEIKILNEVLFLIETFGFMAHQKSVQISADSSQPLTKSVILKLLYFISFLLFVICYLLFVTYI